MIEQDEFIGGDPSIDFVNTIGGIRSGVFEDKLATYDDLLQWATLAGALVPTRLAALSHAARKDPRGAAAALARARAIRESIHDAYLALANGRAAPRQVLGEINAVIGSAMSHTRIHRIDGNYEWGWDDALALEAPLWPILRATGEILVSGEWSRLRECASETCGWLFLDKSKNRSRRWCDMKGCGNRAKVRRYRGLED
jgi:predicted RNA-binding Zn ribbon-like protein